MNKSEFLDKYIFIGLTNLNDGFDVETIKYFSEKDFRIVLERVEKFGIGIFGIEPFSDGLFYDVKTHEDYNTQSSDPDWYHTAFEKFVSQSENLQYAAIVKKLNNWHKPT